MVWLASRDAPGGLKRRLAAPWWAWAGTIGGYVLLVLPQILHVLEIRERLVPMDHFSARLGGIVERLPYLLTHDNALVMPQYTSPLLLPAALTAAVVAHRGWPARRFRLSLLAIASVWMIGYYTDLSSASLPRLHVVLVLPCVWLAGALLAEAWRWRPARAVWAGRALAAAGFAALIATSIPSATWMWQPTNERAEDEAFLDAVAQLPAGPLRLLRVGTADLESGDYTHQHHPDYLVTAADVRGTPLALRTFMASPTWDVPVFFYRGLRCYSAFRTRDRQAPERYYRPACAALADAFELAPVWERVVPNRGDIFLQYYSREPDFRLGLYRVRPKGVPQTR